MLWTNNLSYLYGKGLIVLCNTHVTMCMCHADFANKKCSDQSVTV